MKCPEFPSHKPETSTFCADYGTCLASPEDISLSVTKTMVSLVTEGSTVATKYRIIEKLGELITQIPEDLG